jgi:uncharacterized protein DUF4388
VRELPPEGRLADRDVPSLVRSLHEAQWTGLVSVTSAGVSKSVTVQDGRMVFASSSSVDDRLGELLLVQGRLRLQQFIDGSRAMGSGKRLGTVLVEMGALTPKELVRAVVEQTQEIIYSLFLWTEGQYRLEEGPPSAEAIKLNLSTPDLIMEGIRRIRAWSRIEHAVGGPEALYKRSEGYESVAAHMTLGPEARAVVDQLDGVHSVRDICATSPLADVEVCRLIWASRVIGMLALVEAAKAPVASQALIDDDGLASVLGGDP